MSKMFGIAFCAVVSLVMLNTAVAHHSMAPFDFDDGAKYVGTVKRYSFRNPHMYIFVEVEKDGKKWVVKGEGSTPAMLRKKGWTRNTVAVGEVITLMGHPTADGKNEHIWITGLIKSDGVMFGVDPFDPNRVKPPE